MWSVGQSKVGRVQILYKLSRPPTITIDTMVYLVNIHVPYKPTFETDMSSPESADTPTCRRKITTTLTKLANFLCFPYKPGFHPCNIRCVILIIIPKKVHDL